jgi:hypothetical protein
VRVVGNPDGRFLIAPGRARTSARIGEVPRSAGARPARAAGPRRRVDAGRNRLRDHPVTQRTRRLRARLGRAPLPSLCALEDEEIAATAERDPRFRRRCTRASASSAVARNGIEGATSSACSRAAASRLARARRRARRAVGCARASRPASRAGLRCRSARPRIPPAPVF